MPSPEPLPSIRELLDAFGAGVLGQRDPRADIRRGSVYDHFAGAGALLFSREAQRDRDLFRARYLDSADGSDLTDLVARRFSIARTLDTHGTGSATLVRPTTAAGEGRIWAGTRILLLDGRSYAALTETHVGAADRTVQIPIRANDTGRGAAVALTGDGIARIDDPLWDATWRVQSLACGDGTEFERAAALRARVRLSRLNARKGYAKAITDACVAAGATHVALFASSYVSDDFGVSACYVADVGFTTSDRLIRACTVALERARVCGADLMVMGMRRASLALQADVQLWDDPGHVNLAGLDADLKAALASAFEGRAEGYAYSLDALRGAILQTSDAVQDVAISEPAGSGDVLVGRPPSFPAVLTRYTLDHISLRYHA